MADNDFQQKYPTRSMIKDMYRHSILKFFLHWKIYFWYIFSQKLLFVPFKPNSKRADNSFQQKFQGIIVTVTTVGTSMDHTYFDTKTNIFAWSLHNEHTHM